MARYNEILVGRFNRFLQKHLSMKGEPPAPQLGTEITPALNVHSDNENLYLEGWDLYGGFTTVAAVAAQNSCWRLRNPASSGVICVITKLLFNSSVATNVNIGTGTTNSDYTTAINTTRRLDARTQRATSPTLMSAQNNGASLGNFAVPTASVVLTDYEFIFHERQEFPLLPGEALSLVTAVVNTQLTVNVIWRERVLEESERT